MSRYVVVLGDATTHDGKVTSASSSFDIAGKNAALLNDTVSCPEHGMNKIIECDVSAYEENGLQDAVWCECHCKLCSYQSVIILR
ncbi:MAG: PAAR domain-containing protein [Haemophilus parainfluenzae]|nr:PAAR domain-containing protein [Haemophilus parainfluenzae]